MGATGRLPGGMLRGDEDDVEEVGDDHHRAVEGQLLLPLGVLRRPKDAHDDRDDDPRHGLRHDGREAEEVALRYFQMKNLLTSAACTWKVGDMSLKDENPARLPNTRKLQRT